MYTCTHTVEMIQLSSALKTHEPHIRDEIIKSLGLQKQGETICVDICISMSIIVGECLSKTNKDALKQ